MGLDSKQSEKDYGRRVAAAEWELVKPFAPKGANTLAESLPLIHDFAAALSVLDVAPTDAILDLGAGPCWSTEWLQRLNLRTVAVDISLDLLAIGRRRMASMSAPRLVAGDMESLPFADATFDRVICLNAIHHAPHPDRAIREVRRILRPAGAAVFSEPGKGHSERPTSVAAVRDFGVTERDVLIGAFMNACVDAGFADVRIKPLAYTVPAVDLRLDEWGAWQRLARRRRPLRALQKIARGVLEIFGLEKDRLLFEEALTMRVVRVLRGLIEEHPIIVAYCRSPT